MGFFDFLRGSGKQVELKPETLKAEISEIGYNANAYEVLVNESTVTVRGMAGSQEEREKVILALGNVEGVEKVEDQIAIATAADLPEGNPVQPESRFHTVKSGDTLSRIAREVYGDANAYMTIFQANKPMLSDPDKIYPGQVLRIPESEVISRSADEWAFHSGMPTPTMVSVYTNARTYKAELSDHST